MYFVVMNGKQIAMHFCKEDALIDAAQFDFMHNSAELNDGVKGEHKIEVLTFNEMMESDVQMII